MAERENAVTKTPEKSTDTISEQTPQSEKHSAQNGFWEVYARIHASNHLTYDNFREHIKVEGYFENRNVPDFLGCDRLMKMDNMFGTVQQGYNPMKKRSFIYANIKTSIYDSAASKYKRELKENTMFRSRKDENENVLYSTKRREDTAVILYKAENKPWTENSIAPYLMRVNQGALRKTMPFLLRQEEENRLDRLKEQRRELHEHEREAVQTGNVDVMSQVRLLQRQQNYEENMIGSMITKKVQRSRWFFRRLNYAFDIQKQAMFEYYRNIKEKVKANGEAVVEDIPANPSEKPENEGN